MINPPKTPQIPEDRERQLIMINSFLNIARGGLDRAATNCHNAGLFLLEEKIREALKIAKTLDKEELRDHMLAKLYQGELFKDGPK